MEKKKIMVVDDNPDVLFSIKQGLEALEPNFEVIGVESGEECIELLKSGEIPDLIVLDIMMPGLSGWEVYNRIKDHPEWKDIPLVFLTARTDETARRIGRFLGEDFIEKPFETKELKERIKRVLREKGKL
ncbi:MAG: response regulator [Thermoplasmata archaeon]|nr:MAG: response regulator [Thermoplasmata archaeon]